LLLVSLGFVHDRDGQDFAWLENALNQAGFVEDARTGGGWRWTIMIDGVVVKLVLLCDVNGDLSNQPLPLPGCPRASADRRNAGATGAICAPSGESSLTSKGCPQAPTSAQCLDPGPDDG
jgi:hypothetical protein